MKILSSFWTFMFLVVFSVSLAAQGFQPPAEGKAVVYFVRVTSYGSGSFEFFHDHTFIGYQKGKGYLRYECDPGTQLFWASSENKEFLPAELKEGGTYIVIVDVVMGFWKMHVGLNPIDENNTELFERAKEVVNSKSPQVTSESKINKVNKKLQKFMDEEISHYEEVSKEKHEFHYLSADMAIPEEALR